MRVGEKKNRSLCFDSSMKIQLFVLMKRDLAFALVRVSRNFETLLMKGIFFTFFDSSDDFERRCFGWVLATIGLPSEKNFSCHLQVV